VALNLRGARRHDLRRGDALVGLREWIDTDTIDVRFSSPIDRPPAQLIVHVGSAAVPARVRPFDALTARLRMARTLPLHVGERVILRDPGPQRVTTGALVLDVLPPPLPRRSGATAARARELTAMSGRSDAAGELSRRRVLRIADLRASGAQPLPLPTGAVTVGDWLVAADRWADWRSSLIAIVRGWAEQHPLQPGMPRTALSKALGLPDPGIAERLIAGLDDVVSDADGVHLRRAAAVVPPPIRRALDQLGRRLAARPFDAPEANELAAAGLSERFLAIATKSGELVRITTGVYLRPDALTHAALVLAELPAPFTLSAARQALGTTRRVAVPLLELLDTRRITRRVDDQRRVVVDRG
jgi:selenocysteine-specific elongation factor